MISDVINRDNWEEEGGNGEELRRTENWKRGKLDWGIKDKFVTKYLLPSLTVLSLAYNIGGLLDYIHSESYTFLLGLFTLAPGRRAGGMESISSSTWFPALAADRVVTLGSCVSTSSCRNGAPRQHQFLAC
jgi:hypothetical protein